MSSMLSKERCEEKQSIKSVKPLAQYNNEQIKKPARSRVHENSRAICNCGANFWNPRLCRRMGYLMIKSDKANIERCQW